MIRFFAFLLLLLCPVLTGFAKEKYQHPGPIYLDHGGEKWAEKTLRKLSLEEKVGQLFMVWVRAEFLNANSPEYLSLRDTMDKYHVGAFAMTVPSNWQNIASPIESKVPSEPHMQTLAVTIRFWKALA